MMVEVDAEVMRKIIVEVAAVWATTVVALVAFVLWAWRREHNLNRQPRIEGRVYDAVKLLPENRLAHGDVLATEAVRILDKGCGKDLEEAATAFLLSQFKRATIVEEPCDCFVTELPDMEFVPPKSNRK